MKAFMLAAGVAAAAFAMSAAAQTPGAQTPAAPAAAGAPAAARGVPAAAVTVRQLKPNVYMAVGGGGNSVFAVTRTAVILVDTKNMGEEQYKNLLAAIRTVTPNPVKFVFDTHHHADHTGNNEYFKRDGAKVIGQESMAEVFRTYTSTLAPRTPATPDTLYKTTYKVTVDGVVVEGFHYGPGHTGNDTVVWFPATKVVAAGDLVDSRTPSYDAPFGGSLRGYSAALNDILKLNFETAVGGHGEAPLTRAEVQAYKGKIDTLIERAQQAVRSGVPKDKFIETVKTDDLGWKLGGIFWAPQPRLDALYAELSAQK